MILSCRLTYFCSPRMDCQALSFPRLTWHSHFYKRLDDDDYGDDNDGDNDYFMAMKIELAMLISTKYILT